MTRAHRLLSALLVAFTVPARAVEAAGCEAQTIPTGTQIAFHVDAPISSNESETGGSFTFELEQPIALADCPIPMLGTTGSGTVFLAGHAGTSGHEGDLTLGT